MLVSCPALPAGASIAPGKIWSPVTTAAVTWRLAWSVTPSSVASMLVVPMETPRASPSTSITATTRLLLCQPTSSVRSLLLPSEKIPVALYCTVRPLAMFSLAGVTTSSRSTAGVTVAWAVPVTPAKAAVRVAPPSAKAVARPASLPLGTTSTVAGADEVQIARVVTSPVVRSV